MNVGDCVYLRLEGFNPSWRQAVVVAGKKNGSLRLGVRVTANEADTKAGLLTSFSVGGETFILVEGSLDRLRPACTQAHRSLEVDHALVLSSALETLKDDNIQYATASEDLSDAGGTMFPKPPAHRQKLVSSDSEEEESEESDADHVLKMLKRASKSETGMVTGKDKSKKGLSKTKSRYPLLARTGEKAKNLSAASDPLAWMMQSASSAEPVVDPMQMNAFIQMELLKELRGRKAKSKTMLEDRSEDSDSSLETSSGGDEKLKGAGKALRAYRKNKRRMRRQPEKHIRRYIKEVEEVLGVGAEGAYTLTDYTRRLSWGKNHTLHRLHFALSDVLQTVLKGKLSLVGLQITQLLRAIHQASLDGGSWRTAWLLLDLPDPLDKPRFGGEAQQLEVVASYVKAMSDLEKKSKTFNRFEDDTGSNMSQKGKGKTKGKKAKDEDKPES